VIIAPLTTNLNNYPTRIKLILEGKEGRIVIDQIRTIDKLRVIKVLGSITKKEMQNIKLIMNKTFVE